MLIRYRLLVPALLLSCLGVLPVQATILAGPDIIAPPLSTASVGGAFSTHQQGFDELQNVTLPSAVATDAGSLPTGLVVNSHMIFLHQWEQLSSPLVDTAKVWTFDGPVVGVMSDANGILEGASTPILGWPGTFYPAPFTARGIESMDSYVVSGNSITVNLHVGQPGDYIRVVTVPGGTTPVPRTTWGRLRRAYR